jgi:hypothetical protein
MKPIFHQLRLVDALEDEFQSVLASLRHEGRVLAGRPVTLVAEERNVELHHAVKVEDVEHKFDPGHHRVMLALRTGEVPAGG